MSPPTISAAGPSPRAPSHAADRTFRWAALLAAMSIFVLIGLVGWELYAGSRLSIQKFGLNFLGSTTWDPVADQYGALPFIYGTLASSLLALAIAVPISLGVAIFLSELAPAWLRGPVGFLVELLAAVPSVVYGLWGIFALTPWLRESVEPLLARYLGFLPFFQGPHWEYSMPRKVQPMRRAGLKRFRSPI